jgi:hypothetical protein
VPPDTKEHLREQISARNPAAAFVQGFAGIPGLIVKQAEAALSDGTTGPTAAVTYNAQSRSIGISLDGPQDVTVTAWRGHLVPPREPKSTSRVILDKEFPAGAHTIAIPARSPPRHPSPPCPPAHPSTHSSSDPCRRNDLGTLPRPFKRIKRPAGQLCSAAHPN